MERKILLSILFLNAFLQVFSQHDQVNVVILKGKLNDSYIQAISEFKREIKREISNVNIAEINYENSLLDKELENINPEIIVSIGTSASISAVKFSQKFPVVYSMVLDPEESEIIEKGLRGVSLNIPLESKFEIIKSILPDVRNIGIIYNETENSGIISEAEKFAEDYDLRIVEFPVNDATQIPELISIEIDALLLVPDNTVCQQAIIRRLLLSGIKSKIPVIGISQIYVKAGALFSLSCDYTDIGEQTADLAIQVINSSIERIPKISYPRKFDLYINETVANIISIDIDEKLLNSAKKVY